MNDKEFKEQKNRVSKLLDKWYKTLGLGWEKTDIHWSRSVDPESTDCVGRADTLWQYRTANLTFYLPNCAELDDEKLEGVIVHELTHILLGAISGFVPDDHQQRSEYTTETVTRAIMWAREAGKKDK